MIDDVLWGLMMMVVGMGGVTAEVVKDRALGLPPLDLPADVVLDGDRIEVLERMAKQQPLRLGVQRRSLNAAPVPGRPDLQPAVGRVDVHVGGHADGAAGGGMGIGFSST